jgi:alkanesulfonate monooxygenase SsuD/methylene tetrahydromethanopterin reductase-like flavin-dependent oxidoreductase (luciferase family)
MKFLYYSPIPWPHLQDRPSGFPHDNTHFESSRGTALYESSLRLFKAAEDAGFDWVGVGEEHMNAYGVVPNPCLIGAAIAATTRRVKVAMLGNPLPLLNPLRVAEEYAMLDVMSGGRLVAGFPRGVPQNYAAYGASPVDSKERLAEAVGFVLKAWETKGPFDWDGYYYTFKNVSIWPQPKSRPELVMSGRSEESVALAVQQRAIIGELYLKNAVVFEHFKASVERYRADAIRSGWEAGPDRFLISVPCVIAGDENQARQTAEEGLAYQTERLSGSFESQKVAVGETYYGTLASTLNHEATNDLDAKIAYGGLICGTPEGATAQILELVRRAGVGVLGLQMQFGNLPDAAVLRSIRLFGDLVRPTVKWDYGWQ